MPAPMTTTRAAPGCVLKRTSSGQFSRTVATVGRTAWSAILLAPARAHPGTRTPRLKRAWVGASLGSTCCGAAAVAAGLLVEDPVRLVVDPLLLARGEVALLDLLRCTRLGVPGVRLVRHRV